MGTTGQSITLANSIIGVGILAMPFCFQQCGVLLASLILVMMGLVSRICCHFLLKSALLAKRRNFEFLAFHVFGPAGKLAVELGIIGFLMGTCIAYFVVVGDLGPQIIAKMFNINQSDMLRTSIMVIVSLVCVLPLGLLRNVDSFNNVSAATIAFYFCLVLKVIAEGATQLLSGEWHTKVDLWKPSGFLQCVPIFSMALFCQTQLFEIFESMPALSLEKMNRVTKNAINICTGVYFTLGIFGYIAFCSQDISGNILMSLSPTWVSDIIKLGFVMSLAFSFPLIIFPCRASLYSFLFKKVPAHHHEHACGVGSVMSTRAHRCMTLGIVGVALGVSLALPTVELVLGLLGATVGVLVCVVFPAVCFLHLTRKDTNERHLAKVILFLGLGIMLLGTYANLQAAEYKLDRYDDNVITQERIDKIVEDFFETHKLEKSGAENMRKPEDNLQPLQLVEQAKVGLKKDSEIQPPNPVPPESISNEIVQKPILNNLDDKKASETKNLLPVEKAGDILTEEKLKEVDAEDKESEPLQKNVNGILKDTNIDNGDNGINSVNNAQKDEKTKSNEDKLNMIKQQQLIETIKQHGEEQKELLKEQKEILDEIHKTKKELQQNQKEKEVDSSKAKQIAVESIQKIANVAIQSLSGVSENPGNKPYEVGGKNSEPLSKTANDAVVEIAKKAVETIEAINEIKEKPKLDNVQSKVLDSGAAGVLQNIDARDIASVQNRVQASVQPNVQAHNNLNIGQPANAPVNTQPELSKNNEVNKLVEISNLQNSIGGPNLQIKANEPVLTVDSKPHSHSPDEPQSYKLGEDSQPKNIPEIKTIQNIVNNVPIPLALNNNLQINKILNQNYSSQKAINENKATLTNVQVPVNNAAKENNVANNRLVMNNDVGLRKKREALENERLEMDIRDLNKNIVKEEVLPEIDLNESLQRNVLFDQNSIHLRSLKSLDEAEDKR